MQGFLNVAQQQVEGGAQIIDVTWMKGLAGLGRRLWMKFFVGCRRTWYRLSAIMVDSSKFHVIEAGLRCLQGKSIVNSIFFERRVKMNLSTGRFVLGLALRSLVAFLMNRARQTPFREKWEICQERIRFWLNSWNFSPYDIIFDPNIFAVATGIESITNMPWRFGSYQNNQGNFPVCAKVSGGVSNLSFSFRGNNTVRRPCTLLFISRNQGRHGYGHRKRRHVGRLWGDTKRSACRYWRCTIQQKS